MTYQSKFTLTKCTVVIAQTSSVASCNGDCDVGDCKITATGQCAKEGVQFDYWPRSGRGHSPCRCSDIVTCNETVTTPLSGPDQWPIGGHGPCKEFSGEKFNCYFIFNANDQSREVSRYSKEQTLWNWSAALLGGFVIYGVPFCCCGCIVAKAYRSIFRQAPEAQADYGQLYSE